ncbi:integral membrane family protein [Fistulina hepatica ATCC 64428]|uniref:Integral membrane family protein n=1 Tax=Fistulina hepatica ATCC 64428 TaxID=1128425 RepID=A0A0D7A7Y3_9AGAR|nr:integral membrane family protein [Fistulina hepatica ATCC 64428]
MAPIEPGPLFLAVLLSVSGLRKKSLSPSGALTAFFFGYAMMSGGTTVFGVSLIGFYLLGSRATKFGKARKAQLEDSYHEGGYGYRSGWQVVSNASSATVATCVWNVLYAPDSLHAYIGKQWLTSDRPYVAASWCPIDGTVSGSISRALVFAVLGHFSCCLGDTLASELGILSTTPPISIITLKPVPPGTNGGVSALGTFASIAGGAVMGFMMALCLIAESASCRSQWTTVLWQLTVWGMSGGGFGSLERRYKRRGIQRRRNLLATLENISVVSIF